MEVIRQIESDILIIKELKNLLGKKVKINIEVVEEAEQNEQKPEALGKYKLGKELDQAKLRSFAYEETETVEDELTADEIHEMVQKGEALDFLNDEREDIYTDDDLKVKY